MSELADKAEVELTKEEALLIAQFLKTTPVTGTLEALPKAFTQITTILQKLDAAFVVVTPSGPPIPTKPKRTRH